MRHDNSPAAAAYAWLVFLALVVGVALALLLWPRPAGAQPVAPCATPAAYVMPTARVGRPMDARPTYSARLAMPTSGAVTPGGSGR